MPDTPGCLPTDGFPPNLPPALRSTVAKSAPQQKHLRLYTEQPPKPVRPPIEAVGCLPELLRAFQAVTGCPLRYEHGPKPKEPRDAAWSAPVRGEAARTAGYLVLNPPIQQNAQNPATAASATGVRNLETKSVQTLAGSIADLLGELLQTRHALRQREAELAAAVPVVPHREEEKHLATRLEAVLRAGVDALGCDAAGVYLLDETTTELKLRCAVGLPFDRLAAPARPLQGAMADLEALLGHAVVLDDSDVMQTWNVPEDFPAAACVPISTPTMLLGTLWLFSNEKRDFNDRETNILEVIAGRLASDLEREMLMRAGVDGMNLQKQVAAAERLQRNELPTIAPLLDGWDVAGWTAQAESVGGAFHDWFCLPDGLLAVAAARADEQGIAGAMTAIAVKSSLRSHARYHRQAERVVQQVNLTLWTGSAGDRLATLFHGLIRTATGRVSCALAGCPSIVLLGGDAPRSFARSAPKLGESPEAAFDHFSHELQPGESLVIFTGDIGAGKGQVSTEAVLADALHDKRDLSAAELVAAAQGALNAQDAQRECHDGSILVIKRTTP